MSKRSIEPVNVDQVDQVEAAAAASSPFGTESAPRRPLCVGHPWQIRACIRAQIAELELQEQLLDEVAGCES